MQRIKRFIVDFWPSMLTLGVVLYATLASDPMGADELPAIPHIDKLIHAVMMGGLLGAIAFDISRRDKRLPSRKTMWILFGCFCIFGLADEFMQSLPWIGRGCDPADYLADLAGAFAAVWLAPPAIAKVLKLKRKPASE